MTPSPTHLLPDRSEAGWSRDTGDRIMAPTGPEELFRWLKLFSQFMQQARELVPAGRALIWRASSEEFCYQILDHNLLVGRAKDCDIVLADPAVSRRHFRVTPDAATVRVSDCDSTHGTWVNRRKVQTAVLQAPALIQAGGSALLFIDVGQMAAMGNWRRSR